MRNLVYTCALFCISCASPGGRTLIGALAGSAAGLATEKIFRVRNSQSASFIVLLGASAGAATGYYLEPKASTPEVETKELTRAMAPFSPTPAPPVIVPPAVDSYFVDDQVRGTTFVPGHMEYKIKEAAKWQK